MSRELGGESYSHQINTESSCQWPHTHTVQFFPLQENVLNVILIRFHFTVLHLFLTGLTNIISNKSLL